MSKISETVMNFIKKISFKDIVYVLIIVILLCCLSYSVNRCTDEKVRYKNNIIALHDTIRYYEADNGDMVATIRAFEAELKEVKLLNKDLYERVKNLKPKGDVTNATYFTGVIDNPQRDTTYVIEHDTISQGFKKDFAFNDEYRTLEGNVTYEEDTLGVNIEKDQVQFDYTVAMDDKNNIMIHSSNPYVKFNEMTGFQIPTPKRKRWSLGPAVNFGYDPVQGKFAPSIGISLNYGILQW